MSDRPMWSAVEIAHRAHRLLAEAPDARSAIPAVWLEAGTMWLERSSVPHAVLDHFDYLCRATADAFDWEVHFSSWLSMHASPPLKSHVSADVVLAMYTSCVILCAGILIAAQAPPPQYAAEQIAAWHARGFPTVGEHAN